MLLKTLRDLLTSGARITQHKRQVPLSSMQTASKSLVRCACSRIIIIEASGARAPRQKQLEQKGADIVVSFGTLFCEVNFK